MKTKTMNWMLLAALTLGLGMSVTSCKDDDDNNAVETASTVTIGGDLLTRGLETDARSAVVEVPVTSEGSWHATLASNASDWARVQEWDVEYTGDKTLSITIDANLTGAGRSTTLFISNSDGDTQRVTIRQTATTDGASQENGSGEKWADAGLGCGVDYDYALNMKAIVASTSGSADMEFQPTKVHGLNNLFNITRIQELQASKKLQNSAYVESAISLAELNAQLFDSCVVQSKSIDVALTIGVELGPVAFNANGHYSASKEESRAKVDYTITRYCPMYNVYLSPAELSSYATDPQNNHVDYDADEDAMDQIDAIAEHYRQLNERKVKRGITLVLNEDGLTEDQQEEIERMYDQLPVIMDYAGIFSTSFTKRYNELYNAIQRPTILGKDIDYAAANQTLNAIDNEYGPFFIAGGDYGGLITMHCDVDTMRLEGKASISGELSADLMGGLFDVHGEFSYNEDGLSLLRNSNTKMFIYGGNANETASNLLGLITGGDATNMNLWQGYLQAWIESMWSKTESSPVQSAAAPISFVVTPIWTLFREAAIQQYAQDYFMAKYADRNIESYFGIMKGNYQPTIDDILTLDSDFWKK